MNQYHRYLLDTNIISDLMQNPQGKVAKQIAQVGEDAICTSIILAGELEFGGQKNGSAKLKIQTVLRRKLSSTLNCIKTHKEYAIL